MSEPFPAFDTLVGVMVPLVRQHCVAYNEDVYRDLSLIRGHFIHGVTMVEWGIPLDGKGTVLSRYIGALRPAECLVLFRLDLMTGAVVQTAFPPDPNVPSTEWTL